MTRRLTRNTLDPERLPLLLTVSEYAYITRQSEESVRVQLRAGTLKGVKVSKTRWRIPREVLIKMLKYDE